MVFQNKIATAHCSLGLVLNHILIVVWLRSSRLCLSPPLIPLHTPVCSKESLSLFVAVAMYHHQRECGCWIKFHGARQDTLDRTEGRRRRWKHMDGQWAHMGLLHRVSLLEAASGREENNVMWYNKYFYLKFHVLQISSLTVPYYVGNCVLLHPPDFPSLSLLSLGAVCLA